MTPEYLEKLPLAQWNALIAQRCGWTRFAMFSPHTGKCAIIGHDTLHGTPPCDKDKPEDDQQFLPVPAFSTSLDAMALAEATLTDSQYERFMLDLWTMVAEDQLRQPSCPIRFERAYLSATAQQRSRAFLLVTEP